MEKDEKSGSRRGVDLTALAEKGLLPELTEHYILECISRDQDEGRKKRILPNVAGFCRFCRIGREDFDALKDSYPDEYSALLSIFEDEALNSDISSSTLAYYMKNILGGESEGEREQGSVIRFEHDILEDGE